MRRTYLLGIIFLLLIAAVHAQNESVSLNIASGFPQNSTYVFECTPNNFTVSAFDWSFGDGVNVNNIPGLVQHTYIENGNYTVSCAADSPAGTVEDELDIEVTFFDGINVTNNTTNQTNTTNVTNTTNQTGNVTPPINQTNTTNVTNQTGNGSNQTTGAVSIAIASGFPQGNNVVLVCQATNFTATSYDWIFGDGQMQTNMTANNVFHIYASQGTYNASCVARADSVSDMSSPIQVTIGAGNVTNNTTNQTNQTNTTNQTGNQTGNQTSNGATLDIAPWYPKGSDFVFVCRVEGFTPTKYSWFYGDDQKLINISNRDTYHRYTSTGTFNVSCSATDGANTAFASRVVTVTNTTPPDSPLPPWNGTAPGCFVDLSDIPATCKGGTIVNDTDERTFDNCRHTTCSNGNETLTVLSCEKPDEIHPLFFEMYKLQDTGNLEICIGDACIKDNGFARSGQFPYCAGNVTPPGNQTNNTGNQTGGGTGNQTNVTFSQVHIMKHICPSNVQTVADLQALGSSRDTICPMTVLEKDDFSPNTTHWNETNFGFTVTGANNAAQSINNAVFMQEKICNGTIMMGSENTTMTGCMDWSHYIWSNVAKGVVSISEDTAPAGMRFGAALLENGTYATGPVLVNTNMDDNVTIVHVYNFANNATNQTGGNNQTNQTTTVTLAIMKHLCPPNIQSEAGVQALGGFIQQETGCPTTVRTNDTLVNASAIRSNQTDFDFRVTGGGPAQDIEDAEYHAEQVCFPAGNTTQCADISHYEYNVTRGVVTIHETAAPGTRFGRFIFTDPTVQNNTANNTLVNVDAGNGNIVLDLSKTNDTEVMIHVYNFVNVNQSGVGGGNQTGNQTNNTGNQTNATTNTASLMTGFPLVQYNFTCQAHGFTPTGYMWNFGDGIQVNTTTTNMMDMATHTYMSNGLFVVSCLPMGGNATPVVLPIMVNVSANIANMSNQTGTVTPPVNITNVTNGTAVLSLAPGFPQGNNAVLVCNATGFTPTGYDWHFGDGEAQYNTSANNVYHTYTSAGNYSAYCVARLDGAGATSPILSITLGNGTNQTGGNNGTNQSVPMLDLGFTFEGPAYTFYCKPGNFSPTSFAWNFGDNTTTNTSIANTTHTFVPGGAYNVTCNASDGNTSVMDYVMVYPGGTLQNNSNATEATFQAVILPDFEVPPVNDSNATGIGIATLYNDTRLEVNGSFQNLTSDLFDVAGSPAHIHYGPPGAAGPVVFNLVVTRGPDNRSGNFTLWTYTSEQQREWLMNNSLYVNVHTAAYQGGEIRGQLNVTG